MGSKITGVITELVFRANTDLETRLESQAEALSETECINPVLGRWIDENDVNYLLATLALKDEDFAEEFPAMAHVTGQERRHFIAALEVHFDQCPHCWLKRGYDLEMDARIEQACRQNSDSLLQVLREEEGAADLSEEGDYGSRN